MKKLLSVALLSLFSLTAHAWELCPPSTAFWHTNGKNTPWVLDPSYIQRGWSIKEDKAASSDLKFLPADGLLVVHVLDRDMSEHNVGYMECNYYLASDGLFSRPKEKIRIVNEKMHPVNTDNFKFPRYSRWPWCDTTNSMAGKCAW